MIRCEQSCKSRLAGESSCFVFREATDGEELLALLRLRYNAYRNNGLTKLVPENEYGIDVDCYDLRARHFGLFRLNGDHQRPIGCLRAVEDHLAPGSAALSDILVRFPGLRAGAEQVPDLPFPVMSYLPEVEAVQVLYTRLKDAGERLVELSRFALVTSQGSLRLARHMVEATTAILAFNCGIEHAIWCCDSSNRAFYGLYGFRPLEGTADGDFLGLGVRSSCVYAAAARIPNTLRARLFRKAQVYTQSGCIPYTANPEHLESCEQGLAGRRAQPVFVTI